MKRKLECTPESRQGDIMTELTEEFKNCIKEFNQNEETRDYDNAVTKTFLLTSYNNQDFDKVLIKVTVLDRLYYTSLFSIYEMAKHIKDNADELDELISNADIKAIELIRQGHGIKTKNNKEKDLYSFATKYCHWSNLDHKYPIFDSKVEIALNYMKNKKLIQFFSDDDLRNYEKFKKIIDEVGGKINNTSYKEIDKGLWVMGKNLEKNPANKQVMR